VKRTTNEVGKGFPRWPGCATGKSKSQRGVLHDAGELAFSFPRRTAPNAGSLEIQDNGDALAKSRREAASKCKTRKSNRGA